MKSLKHFWKQIISKNLRQLAINRLHWIISFNPHFEANETSQLIENFFTTTKNKKRQKQQTNEKISEKSPSIKIWTLHSELFPTNRYTSNGILFIVTMWLQKINKFEQYIKTTNSLRKPVVSKPLYSIASTVKDKYANLCLDRKTMVSFIHDSPISHRNKFYDYEANKQAKTKIQ